MDAFTFQHMADWVDRQFGDDQNELVTAMTKHSEDHSDAKYIPPVSRAPSTPLTLPRLKSGR